MSFRERPKQLQDPSKYANNYTSVLGKQNEGIEAMKQEWKSIFLLREETISQKWDKRDISSTYIF
jgi:hypothetical protein